MTVFDGMKVAAAGMGCGVIAAVALGETMSSLLEKNFIRKVSSFFESLRVFL